jgi:hypothetical protein
LDHVTLACHLLGGVLGALLAGALSGNLRVGVIGDLILIDCLTLAPAALPDGTIAVPATALGHVASGAAGGTVLMVVIGLLKSLVRN